jgi:hypothetical protein
MGDEREQGEGLVVGAPALGFLEQVQPDPPEIIGGNGGDLSCPTA